jgi:hypothetical protein
MDFFYQKDKFTTSYFGITANSTTSTTPTVKTTVSETEKCQQKTQAGMQDPGAGYGTEWSLI